MIRAVCTIVVAIAANAGAQAALCVTEQDCTTGHYCYQNRCYPLPGTAPAAAPTPPPAAAPARARPAPRPADAPDAPEDGSDEAPDDEAPPRPGAKPSLISAKGLKLMTFGLEAQVGLGGGVFFNGTNTAFFREPSSSSSSSRNDVFGGGLAKQVSIGLVLGNAHTIGFQGTWSDHAPAPGVSSTTFDSSLLAFFYRLSMSKADSKFGAWFQLEGGGGYFNATSSTVFGPTTLKISGLGAAARLGLDYAILPWVPNLRLGASAGLGAWLPFESCTEVRGMENCSRSGTAPNGNFTAVVSLRFTLPLTTRRPPPPPPTRRYVLVTSTLDVSTSDASRADVTDTPVYRQQLDKTRQVAISAPSSCTSETAANRTGAASSSGAAILKTECGVEMSEVERALTRAGYSVASWRTVAALVGPASRPNMTPTEAAAKLGAQVLFQVNSLEKITAEPARNARWERRFYMSDSQANQGQPALLSNQESAELRPMIEAIEGDSLKGMRQGAMLDINAIHVATGQTMWFYRWQKLDTDRYETGARGLYTQVGAGPWAAVAWPTGSRPSASPTMSTGEVRVERSGGGPESASEALYFQLMREVVRDFVGSFTGTPLPP